VARRSKEERVQERKRERERVRHIDVHAFRLVHICNANLRGDRGGAGGKTERTEESKMDEARGIAQIERAVYDIHADDK